MHKLRILILYPDPAGLALLTSMLKSLGHIIEEATNDRVAVRLMERNDIDLVLAGVDPGDGDALELLTYVRRKHREVPVVLLFPRLHPDRAKEALRLGAMAVLKYPVPAAELRAAVLQALEQCEARQGEPAATRRVAVPAARLGIAPVATKSPQPVGLSPALTLHPGMTHAGSDSSVPAPSPGAAGTPSSAAMTLHVPALSPAHRLDLIARELGLIGNDPSWRQVLELAGTLAPAAASVLIVGEPGTGKSLVARLLHALGPGAHYPFVAIDDIGHGRRISRRPSTPVPARRPPTRRIPPSTGRTSSARPVAGRSTSMKSPDCPWRSSTICSANCNSASSGRPRRIPRCSARCGS